VSEPRERAARLLRWYPRAWRARYGEEFTELLLADLAERSRSAARTADVIRGGLVARLADAGLCGCAPQVPELARARARAGLASLACCAAVFLGVGGAIWSQLVIGWQWSAPATAGTVVATFVMTATVLVLALLTLLAALPVAWTVATRLAGGRARGLAVPSALFLAGLVIMIVGGRHFGNGWPAPAVIRGREPAWCPAAWPRSAGRARCPSPRSGRTPPRWPPSRRPNSPG
jgi:hypothetical protein